MSSVTQARFQLFSPLPEDKYQALKADIQANGVLVPVEIDQNGQVLDGHHRIRAWRELRAEGIQIADYPRVIRSFDNDDDREEHAAKINCNRRDVSVDDKQRVALAWRQRGWSYRRIADALGVGVATAHRWIPEAESTVPSGTVDLPDRVVGKDGKSRPATMPRPKPAAFVTNSREQERALTAFDYATPLADEDGVIEHLGNPVPLVNPGTTYTQGGTAWHSDEPKQPHVSHNSGENEWYTPSQYIEAAREVLGTIDLDPASSDVANERVKATSYFTKEDNGLAHEWHGNVWMNPPYAQPIISEFCEKVVEEFEAGRVKAAIVLVNNATETRWFKNMEGSASAIAFPSGRIRYLDSSGSPANTPLQGQAFLYFGDDYHVFARVFRQLGTVWGVL